MGRVDPARQVAFGVLKEVEQHGAFANLALASALAKAKFDPATSARDAAFVTELVSGTLRGQGTYDAVLAPFLRSSIQDEVRIALRMGVHQLLAMRVGRHAAVATTVDLVRSEIGHRPTGLVNAVLRKVAVLDYPQWRRGQSLAVRTSHPEWVVHELAAALGEQASEPTPELEIALRANNLAPAVTLVARPGLCEVDELPGTRLSISPYAVELDSGDPGDLAAVRQGRAAVQDAGSQAVALTLAQAPLAGRDSAWLDMCAGPGGKAGLLGALARHRGARLVAGEISPHRAQLIAKTLQAIHAASDSRCSQAVVADSTQPPWREGAFDRVLVDAPCSGLGALRRRPEARWRKQPGDLDGLVRLQAELVRNGLRALRPGGVLMYATCSPVVSETTAVVRRVLEDDVNAQVEAGPAAAELLDAPAIAGWGDDSRSVHMERCAQLWPHRHGTDAMFLALLRRV